ncbi:hypothetical protein GCM10011383_17830 [Hymenobacter cavernae]|uniref:Uncharacterized protein n=1 Tax=Hymenobacter cavernae TaxID=2044852 RepID=A0ABQ1TZ00_9BACT|nr:hypothetical protein GCM10011383_17830 [Hymenobacter cavernae]
MVTPAQREVLQLVQQLARELLKQRLVQWVLVQKLEQVPLQAQPLWGHLLNSSRWL